jgi:hypothetical protein
VRTEPVLSITVENYTVHTLLSTVCKLLIWARISKSRLKEAQLASNPQKVLCAPSVMGRTGATRASRVDRAVSGRMQTICTLFKSLLAALLASLKRQPAAPRGVRRWCLPAPLPTTSALC